MASFMFVCAVVLKKIKHTHTHITMLYRVQFNEHGVVPHRLFTYPILFCLFDFILLHMLQ